MAGHREFTQEQMEDIFRRALRKQVRPGDSLTLDEMLETAREMGISEEALSAAIEEYEDEGELDQARRAWTTKRRQKFLEHLRAYLIVNGACLILDLLVTGGTWFYYVMIGWGIGLAFDASDALWPNPDKVERQAQKLLRRQQRERNRNGKRTIQVSKGRIVVETPSRRIEIG